MNILLAVYLAQLGFNYGDVLWILLPPPGNLHWLRSKTLPRVAPLVRAAAPRTARHPSTH
jgi:hypothetical protein